VESGFLEQPAAAAVGYEVNFLGSN
jgi:hypothetical protein